MNELPDMAALYVVDALEPDETAEFETHLADCPDCQQEVLDLRIVTEQLSHSAEADPPPSLRAAILARIAEPAAGSPTPTDAPEADGRVPSNVTALRPRRPSRVPYLVAAASLLLAVGFGGWALQSHRDVSQANSHYTDIAQLLATPDVRTVAGSASGGGSGTVVLSRTKARALFVAEGMPALSSDKVYELWTITKAPVPAGTFTPGDGPAVVNLPTAALSAARILLTVEPSGGSDQPTTKPVMSVKVPHSA